ncbi:hypothetical protein V1517DRAFT_331322 [Lipomyces orientalis]|uniref:Uncharacterized protein n=1 Tax=Lipomyces orientalis TaxID=1233043 RepID=A0ACC3TFB9_9ASCO
MEPAVIDKRVGLDSWMEITDPKERRRHQNRLHQRTWRQRQTAQRGYKAEKAMPGMHVMRLGKASRPKGETFPLPTSVPVQPCSQDRRPPISTQILHGFIRNRTKDCSFAAVLVSRAFPLSADHRLITLVQYNVVRGLFTNISILSLHGHLRADCEYGLNIAPLPYPPTSRRPATFEPTHVQLTVNHAVWIDIVPSPQLRDSLILHQGHYDGDDLCNDLVGGLYDGFDEVEVRGMMLWAEPWVEDSWEMSEGFVKKWVFLLQGCSHMMEATNRWREGRGEDRLSW